MKKTKWFAALAAIGLALFFAGCKTEDSTENGGSLIPGGGVSAEYSKVSDVQTTAGNGMVKLDWTNPSDVSFYGTEITFTPAVNGVKQPIIVTGVKSGKSAYIVQGLANETKYTFSLAALYKSEPSKEEGTPESSGQVDVSDTPTNSVADMLAPAAVTELKAESLAEAVRLTWKDPADKDLFGIEVAWKSAAASGASSGRSIASMEAETIFVAPGTQCVQIPNLKSGTEYTFTVKAMDTSGNKSAGAEVSATPADFVDVNNAGLISLANVDNGIMVSITVPETTPHVSLIQIFRTEHGTDNFSLAIAASSLTKRKLDSILNFIDYYVDPGTAYDYKVHYYAVGDRFDPLKVSETDSLQAKSGLGVLRFKSEPKLAFNSDVGKYEFSFVGDSAFDNFLEKKIVAQNDIIFYLGLEEDSKTDPARSLVTLRTDYSKNIKSVEHEFRDSEYVNKPLVPKTVNSKFTILDGDFSYRYFSVPEDFSYAVGAPDGAITFGDKVPAKISDVEGGVEYSADLTKFESEDVYRVDFETSTETKSHKGTRSSVSFSDESRTNPVPFKEIKYVKKDVNFGEKYKFTTRFRQGSGCNSYLTITVLHTAAHGEGEVDFADDLKIVYDKTTGNAELSAKEGKVLKNTKKDEYVSTPEKIELTLDGAATPTTFAKSYDEFQHRIVDDGYFNDISVAFRPLDDGTYFTNFIYRLTNKGGSGILGKPLYPHGSRVYSRYEYKDANDVKYRVDTYTADNQSCIVEGLEEPLIVTDTLSGRKFTVSNPDGKAYGAKEITLGKYNTTGNNDYINLTVLYSDGVTTCAGKMNLKNNRYVEINNVKYDCKISGDEMTLTYKSGTPQNVLGVTEITGPDEVDLGEEITLKAAFWPEDATTNYDKNWYSSDDNVVNIDYTDSYSNTCTVLGCSECSTATITAKAGKTSVTKTITVKPYVPKSITIYDDNGKGVTDMNLTVGNRYYIRASYEPWAEKYDWRVKEPVVNWTLDADNEKVVEIDSSSYSDGTRCYIKPVSAGTTTITAEVGGRTASVKITVNPYVAEEININGSSEITLPINESYTLYAYFTPYVESDYMYLLTWTSSDDSVVTIGNTVGQECYITALKPGTATITAEIGGKSDSMTITVPEPESDGGTEGGKEGV